MFEAENDFKKSCGWERVLKMTLSRWPPVVNHL